MLKEDPRDEDGNVCEAQVEGGDEGEDGGKPDVDDVEDSTGRRGNSGSGLTRLTSGEGKAVTESSGVVASLPELVLSLTRT